MLEEKNDDESDTEDLDTDEEGNVFDKLLRRTVDPGRSDLIQPYVYEDSDDTEESDSEESVSEEQDSDLERANESENENNEDVGDTNSTKPHEGKRKINSTTTIRTSKLRDTG